MTLLHSSFSLLEESDSELYGLNHTLLLQKIEFTQIHTKYASKARDLSISLTEHYWKNAKQFLIKNTSNL